MVPQTDEKGGSGHADQSGAMHAATHADELLKVRKMNFSVFGCTADLTLAKCALIPSLTLLQLLCFNVLIVEFLFPSPLNLTLDCGFIVSP